MFSCTSTFCTHSGKGERADTVLEAVRTIEHARGKYAEITLETCAYAGKKKCSACGVYCTDADTVYICTTILRLFSVVYHTFSLFHDFMQYQYVFFIHDNAYMTLLLYALALCSYCTYSTAHIVRTLRTVSSQARAMC